MGFLPDHKSVIVDEAHNLLDTIFDIDLSNNSSERNIRISPVWLRKRACVTSAKMARCCSYRASNIGRR